MIEIPISPLQADPLTRDYYAHWDAYAIGQLAPLARRTDCYAPKFYKAPASQDELIQAYGYVECGLTITPGSLVYGFYAPALVSTGLPPAYNVQITDLNLKIDGKPHTFWDEPIPSVFLGNYKPAYLSGDLLQANGLIATFPHLLSSPHPVVGAGRFLFQFWDTTGGTAGPAGSAQRLELVVGVLEAKEC
jgi:hypothetical protein